MTNLAQHQCLMKHCPHKDHCLDQHCCKAKGDDYYAAVDLHEAIFGKAFRDLPDGVDEMRAKYAAKPGRFPTVVRAEDMLRECIRDRWQMAPHPILWIKGKDHD